MTADRPILMSAPMVRASLANLKRQTRRICKPQPENDGSGGVVCEADSWIWRGGRALERAGYGADYVHTSRAAMERAMLRVCPYGQRGDLLWVRETWRCFGGREYEYQQEPRAIRFRADADPVDYVSCEWRPSIFMPRWASRLTLRITGVRVERLQDISQADCIAEGIPAQTGAFVHHVIADYRRLWGEINGRDSWDKNPWVWVIGFDTLLQNVDQVVRRAAA